VRREKSRRRRRPAKSLPAEEEREEEEEEEHEREEREREDEMLLLFSTAKERAVVVVVVVEMRLASVILFSSCEEHERKKKISTFSTKKRERESSVMKKKKKDDDLSRFNSSSSSSEEEEEEEEDKRIVEDGGKKWFADAAKSQPTTQPPTSNPISSTGEVAQQQPETKKRMNAAERKRLKKRDSQSARVERRKRERERMERDKREGEEESRAEKKKKKKKKKKKATAEEESDGGDDENDVTETDEEEEEEERKIGQTKKNHRTTFEVEGVALADGTLVLVDKRSSVVYSSEERDDNGEHKRIGTWNAATKTVVKRDDEGEDGNANRNGRSNSSSSEQSDNNASSSSSSSLSSQEEEEEEKQREPTELVKLDVNHTFECNPDDHCETSLEAHKDIVNFLNIVASQKNKKPSELVIYDPYYCAGATKTNFTELGFPNVINENKDFYEVVAKNEVPEHDVFVTNPPYSEEHVEKCVAFAAKNMTQFSRPYFMLVPSYVVCKPYFVPALLSGGAQGAEERDNALKDKDENEEMNMHKKRGQVLPFYIAPTKRYYYFTPKPLAKLRNKNIAENGMEKKRRGHVGRRGERTSPFLSLWICGFGDDQMEALRLHKKLRKEQVKHYVVARNPKEIPLNVLDEWDPRRRGEPGAQDSSKKANVQKNKKKYF